MDNDFQNVATYIKDILGVVIKPIAWDDVELLPLYLRSGYKFALIRFEGVSFLLMKDINEQETSPAVVRKHIGQVGKRWGGEILYMRERMTAYNRQRLINYKLSFVVPGNQLYLPPSGIDLRDHVKKLRHTPSKFSPATQAVVLSVLLGKVTLLELSPSSLAQSLGYSVMTTSRACDELEAARIVEVKKKGRNRFVQFPSHKMELWQAANPFLRSPVRKTHCVTFRDAAHCGLNAGLTALAGYTMLSPPGNNVIAMGREKWAELKYSDAVRVVAFHEAGSMDLELWSYRPELFGSGGVVDRFSLYLSLEGTEDERVEAALADLLGGIEWFSD